MTKAKPLPPLEDIEQMLDYDLDTGVFRWRINRGRIKKGVQAGTLLFGRNTYIHLRIGGAKYLAHRVAWLLCTKQDPLESQIDHIDGNSCNNRITNLRIATNTQNCYNSKRPKNNTSGYKGAYLDRRSNRWGACIRVDGQSVWLGTFDTSELAHMAYSKAAAELHGEFARTA